MAKTVSDLQMVLGQVAKGDKRNGKVVNGRVYPKLWQSKYGLINIVHAYYQSCKKLYATLFEHPINAVA